MQSLIRSLSNSIRIQSHRVSLVRNAATTATTDKVAPDNPHQMAPGEEIGFFKQVDTFFDRAAAILKEKLIKELPGSDPVEVKRRKVEGILKIIKPCNAVLSISFPLRHDSLFELVKISSQMNIQIRK